MWNICICIYINDFFICYILFHIHTHIYTYMKWLISCYILIVSLTHLLPDPLHPPNSMLFLSLSLFRKQANKTMTQKNIKKKRAQEIQKQIKATKTIKAQNQNIIYKLKARKAKMLKQSKMRQQSNTVPWSSALCFEQGLPWPGSRARLGQLPSELLGSCGLPFQHWDCEQLPPQPAI